VSGIRLTSPDHGLAGRPAVEKKQASKIGDAGCRLKGHEAVGRLRYGVPPTRSAPRRVHVPRAIPAQPLAVPNDEIAQWEAVFLLLRMFEETNLSLRPGAPLSFLRTI
jgi:hypothetical protein